MSPSLAAAFLAAASLYDQSVVRLLSERFADERISWLLVNARSGALIGSRWPNAAEPVAAGSLVKPFTAFAWAERYGHRFRKFTCKGTRSRCWYARGHGTIGIVEAIAHSCNAYFDSLAAELRFDDIRATAARFGVAPPPEAAPSAAWAGREGLWRVRPVEIARAYALLAADPGSEFLRRGMAECARSGTGHAARSGLVKTGTAPCTHAVKAPGDGFVVVLEPADAPSVVLLARVHGVPGAQAAAIAARMIRILREGR